MLVIARKVGEGLRIGERTMIVVQRIRGKRVQLSVSAPDSVRIARAELEPHEADSAPAEEENDSAGDRQGTPNANQP